MRTPGPTFDPEALALAFAKLPSTAWALPVTTADTVNPGYHFAAVVQEGRPRPAATLFRFVLTEFEPVWTAWVAKVPAGAYIAPHIDQGPYRERWHVPIHPAGTFDGREVDAGVSFPVNHWEPHRVDNPTGHDRVHLVIDLAVLVDVPSAPFQRIEDT